MTQPLRPQAMSLLQTLPLECPFAWHTESYLTDREIQFIPFGADLTISFTATRNSKILGYIPIMGSVIGAGRIYKGVAEYQRFNDTHLHHLSHRSICWMIRGTIELFPIIGGLICIVADFTATHLLSKSPHLLMLPDSTPCGYCHTCPEYCRC